MSEFQESHEPLPIHISEGVRQKLLLSLLALTQSEDVAEHAREVVGDESRVLHSFSPEKILKSGLANNGVRSVDVSFDRVKELAHIEVSQTKDLETVGINEYTAHVDSPFVAVKRYEYHVSLEEQFAMNQLDAQQTELEEQLVLLNEQSAELFDQAVMLGLELEVPDAAADQQQLQDEIRNNLAKYDHDYLQIQKLVETAAIDEEAAQVLREDILARFRRQQAELNRQYFARARRHRHEITRLFATVKDQFPALYQKRVEHEQTLTQYFELLRQIQAIELEINARRLGAMQAAQGRPTEWCGNVEMLGIVAYITTLIATK